MDADLVHRFVTSPSSKRASRACRFAFSLSTAWAVAALCACSGAPPSWDRLLSIKINEQFPGYQVSPGEAGTLKVERPGRPAQTVEVAPIALLCQRGPRECDYAVDQMLLVLGEHRP